MRSILKQLSTAVAEAMRQSLGPPAEGVDALVAPAANAQFGDYQSNVAMSLAKKLGQKPRDLAQKIADALGAATGDMLEPASVAGPGFINLRLRREFVERCLMAIPPAPTDGSAGASPSRTAGEGAGRYTNTSTRMAGAADRMGIDAAAGDERQVVVVDYSSPNVAKQMHVGHLRSTIIGDTIARVMDFEGHEVRRQNHLGDWGTQFGMVILGIWHLCMAERRGEGLEYLRRKLVELQEAQGDAGRVRAVLETIRERHQQDLDSDADGRTFIGYLQAFSVDFARLLDSYRFVNAVEKAAASTDLAIVNRATGRKTPLAELSRHVAAMLQGVEGDNEQELAAWRRAREASLRRCGSIYQRLGVLLTDDDVRGESFFDPFLAGIVEELRTKLSSGATVSDGGLRVTCREDKGALCVFIEQADGTPAFKGPTGDALPMIAQKSDGAYLYATTDLAAALYRVSHPQRRPIALKSERLAAALQAKGGGLGGDRILYVVGAPQRLHFQMFFPVVRALGWTASTRPGQQEARLEHVMFGSVLGEDRKMLRTRSGESVKLEDLLDEAVDRARELVRSSEADPDKRRGLEEKEIDHIAETVGIAAVKYADLCQNRNTDYVFSWDKMLATQGNAGPYMLYAYAKIRSIYRKGGVSDGALAAANRPIRLEHPAERALGLRILQLAEAIDAVAETLLPNIVCEYLFDLAGKFNTFYDACPVLQAPDAETRDSRLRLCELTARTLKLGLGLLGIATLERM